MAYHESEGASPTEAPAALEEYLEEWTRLSSHAAKPAPDPDWVRGKCPACGAPIVANCYYVGGKGYILVWECWESLGRPKGEAPCDYRRVL